MSAHHVYAFGLAATGIMIVLLVIAIALQWSARRERKGGGPPAFAEALESVSDLVAATSREKIAENLLDVVGRALDVPRAALFIPAKAGSSLMPLSHRGLPSADAEHCAVEISGDTVIATAHRERRLVAIPARKGGGRSLAGAAAGANGEDGATGGRATAAQATPAPADVLGLTVGIPLIVHGELFGVLGLTAPEWDDWSGRRREMVMKTAALATAALSKIARFEQASAETDEERRRTEEERRRTEEERKKTEEVKNLLAASVSPSIAKQLLIDPRGLSFEGQVREVTVLFSDIWDFTTFSETSEPRLVLKRLNAYLSAMTEVILEYDGTVDKYVGDQIMAYWNAPASQADHAWRAVQATLGMRRKLRELRMQAMQEGREPFRMGIALNTGRATFGYIGSMLKRDITIIGDAVNLGARLEKLTREHGTDIVLGSATYQLVKQRVEAQPLGKVKVKGREEEEVVYQLISLKEEPAARPAPPGDPATGAGSEPARA